jgi:signal transduction histidine kinase
MATSFDVLQTRERLRIGKRFLRLRPRIVALGALGNAGILLGSSAPPAQKLAVGLALGATLCGFFGEAWWLEGRALSERWLAVSLGTTLALLGLAALVTGGMMSPFLPLLFAPVVVGYAAFAGRPQTRALFVGTALLLAALGGLGPLARFPELPRAALGGMLLVSTATSFVLLAVGVTGLVEAHAGLARSLDRLRADMLQEAERRALNVEQLGAQVAHEVKNPLAAARGLVQLVERRLTDERDKQRLGVVVSEVDRALAVLKDYLSFARPLSDLQLGSVAVKELLSDVALVLEARLAEKRVELASSVEPLEILADRQRVRDAVLNLALNAVAALPHGGKLELRASSPSSRWAELCVVDNGPGMSGEQVSRLGTPFASGSPDGTGLGVMLAESVARQHGGSLRFESAPGVGTRAILALPLDAKREPA